MLIIIILIKVVLRILNDVWPVLVAKIYFTVNYLINTKW